MRSQGTLGAVVAAAALAAASPARAQTSSGDTALLVTSLVFEGLLIGGGMFAATVNAWQIGEGTNTPRGARGVFNCFLIGTACALAPLGGRFDNARCAAGDTASDYGYLFGAGNILVGGALLFFALNTTAPGLEPMIALGGAQLGVGIVSIALALAADLYPLSRIPGPQSSMALVPFVAPDVTGAAVRVTF